MGVGNAVETYIHDNQIRILVYTVVPYDGDETSISQFVTTVYPDLDKNFDNNDYMTNRVILTPKNDFVNEMILSCCNR